MEGQKTRIPWTESLLPINANKFQIGDKVRFIQTFIKDCKNVCNKCTYLHIEAELNVPYVTELFGDLMRKRFNKFPRIVYGSSKSMTIKFFS
jgi:hypothetical protein